MSRFDPEKVEWPDTTIRGPRLVGGVAATVEAVVPANAYRELYEAAEQMAAAIEAETYDIDGDVGMNYNDPDAKRLRAALRAYKEGESNE